VPFTLTTKASGGSAYNGNLIFRSFEMNVEDEQLVNVQYGFDTYGPVTYAATP
jgi:hypothetical protein